jgi:hypothetical protein
LGERRRVFTLPRVWDLAAAALVRVFRVEADLPPLFAPNSTRPTLSKASAEARKGSVTRGFIVSASRMFSSARRHDMYASAIFCSRIGVLHLNAALRGCVLNSALARSFRARRRFAASGAKTRARVQSG